MLPHAATYARAALGSPEPRLRRLGATQLGRLLLLPSVDEEGRREAEGALVAALEVRPRGGGCRPGRAALVPTAPGAPAPAARSRPHNPDPSSL
jgi:hypothetical protein